MSTSSKLELDEPFAEKQKERLFSSSYRPKEIEEKIRARWKEAQIQSKVELKLAHKRKLGYVEGPPTLNGEPHMGHLRGRIMKDLWYRYSTMRGNRIDFRGGWDCQGLPVELTAEKELGLSGNKTANLKKVGEEAFVAACKKTLEKYHSFWRKADELIGLQIDDSKAYWTFHNSYIEREWQYLKSAWENKVLDEGYRVTPFCPSCQTSLSSAEVVLGGYENVEDPSMYFKMKVRGADNIFLIAWTTMPFTVITDEFVGVKPNSEYCYVRVKQTPGPNREELWIVGATRLKPLMKELRIENYNVEKRVKGKDLEGLRYEHPLSDLIPEQEKFDRLNQLVHSVLAEEFVDDTTGSGLVHMAPANGEDDFEVSQLRKVPVFNPIDGQASFTSDAGTFSGLFVRDSDEKVGEALKQKGLLLKYGNLKHEYPVCWRSGHRLVWLARRGYFYFVDRLHNMAVEAADKAEYYFEQPRNRFLEIIKEKRPWCISRERIWGNPLPIWKCNSCGEKLGLFNRKDIIKNAKSLPDGENFELHRPWIDRVIVACPKCSVDMQREPFVLDTWHNSGAAPYASLTDREYEEYVPVPFLTEGIDQTRGWAYSLLIENVILQMKPKTPFRAFLFQGFVLDEDGEKMSKSKGNYLSANELLGKESVDLSRFYLIWKSSPIDSVNFSSKEMSTRPYQVLNTLYHMHLFYLQNSSFDDYKLDPETARKKISSHVRDLRKQDRWLLSRLESVVDASTSAYSSSRYHEAARAMEKFLIEDLSQTYIPIVRSEMWEEDEAGKKRREEIYSVLGFVLLECDKLLHPISPFVTDFLSRECFGLESLLLEDWPSSNAEFRNGKLEAEFDALSKVVSVTNSARMKAKLKRRWPLKKAYYLASEEVKDLIMANKDLLLEQTNLLDIELQSNPEKVPLIVSAKPNYELLAPRAKQRMKEVAEKIASSDAVSLYNLILEKGKAKLPGLENFELDAADVQFLFSGKNPSYEVSENSGIVVALDTSRDDELILEGLVRDLARNLQALRKQKKFNPTELLERANVAGLGSQTVSMLERKKEELAFLVRVKSVNLYPGRKQGDESNWSKVEIDGTEILIDIS